MVETLATGLVKALFQNCPDQRSDESLNALPSRVAASITYLTLVATVGDVVRSNRVMAKLGTFRIGSEEGHFRQLPQPRHRCKRVVDKPVETGLASGKAHPPGARANHRRVLALQDASSRKSRPLKEHLRPQSSTTNGAQR